MTGTFQPTERQIIELAEFLLAECGISLLDEVERRTAAVEQELADLINGNHKKELQ